MIDKTEKIISDRIDEHLKVIDQLRMDTRLTGQIKQISEMIVECLDRGGKLLICGNGGSAADSQHLAAEFVSRFKMERKAMDAEALTVNISTLTAVGNDYSFEDIFTRQIEAKGRKGDVLLAISTSGNSINILKALKAAHEKRMKIVGFTGGNSENKMIKLTDYCVRVPSKDTARIQEVHILIGHIICELVEDRLQKN